MSTNKYTTDGNVHSKKYKSDMKTIDAALSLCSCIFGCYLYIVALVTFHIAKMAIKVLRYILPFDSVCDWIEAHDKSFEWTDPRYEPTHTKTKISTHKV